MKLELLRLLREKSYEYREHPFTLKSGMTSNHYVDCRPVTFSGIGKLFIGLVLLEMVKDLNISAVGGKTIGADPIANAISFASTIDPSVPLSQIIDSFSIRDKPKKHGKKGQLVGPVQKGDRVVVVEDVITTGGSTIEALSILGENEIEVIQVIPLVDREEGGRETIESLGFKVNPVFRMSELWRSQ